MTSVDVKKKDMSESGWVFDVVIKDENATTHTVKVEKTYWQKITRGRMTPEALVKKSFVFLLARESKESILSTFNLRDIQKYFPEYENSIDP